MEEQSLKTEETRKHTLKEIIDDYKLTQALTEEFDQLAQLKDKAIDIENFEDQKADLIDVLNAHKNRLIFETSAKNAIDAMVTHLQATTGNTIAKKTITNWNKVVAEKKAFLDMVKTAGFTGLDKFIEYFGKDKGQLRFNNILLTTGFSEIRIELVNSFYKAHKTISQKYNGKSEDGEWGGSYNGQYDGMHFGLKTSFIKALTNKE